VERTSDKQLIAIVDDDESIRIATASLLNAVGYKVTIFPSAEEFLYADTFPATACLILDIRLKGLNGLDLQRQLVAARLQIAIIFITAHASEDNEAKAMRRGAVAFLRKPYQATDLLRSLRTLITES
jgi:FixJ family two-component response regulator